MEPVNIKYNAVTCECAECSELVIITPFDSKDKYDADWTCFECGKVVCESCHDDWERLDYGEQGDEDEKGVCKKCYAMII